MAISYWLVSTTTTMLYGHIMYMWIYKITDLIGTIIDNSTPYLGHWSKSILI